MNRPLARVLLFFIVCGAVLVLPWWISVPILIAMTVWLPFYLEVVFFGFLFDVLYAGVYHFRYTGLVSAAVLLVAVWFVRSRIRS